MIGGNECAAGEIISRIFLIQSIFYSGHSVNGRNGDPMSEGRVSSILGLIPIVNVVVSRFCAFWFNFLYDFI